eukprot:SAG11_NODE_4587_length_1841_cov_9.406429_2_plen_241_part_00
MRYVEPWSLIQLRLLGRDMPPDTAEQCIVKRSQTSDFSERLEEFCVVGLTEIKATAQASTLYVTMRGKTRVGQCALMTAKSCAQEKRPLAERAWEKQGGPRPRWSRLFGALHGMTMAPWIRAAAWQTLEGAIQWGEDRLDWSPTTSLCHFCTQKQKYSVESAVQCHVGVCAWAVATRGYDAGQLCLLVVSVLALAGESSGLLAFTVTCLRAGVHVKDTAVAIMQCAWRLLRSVANTTLLK